MLPADIPFRGLKCMRHLQNLARQNAGLGMGHVHDMWMPMPGNMLAQGLPDCTAPGLRNHHEGIFPIPISPSALSSNIGYRSQFSDEFSEHRSQIVSCEQAATGLYNALDAAIKFCREVEKQFENDTIHIRLWVDPRHIESLWSIKLAWNGVPASEYARNRDSRPASTMVTYNMVVDSLHQSMEELRMSLSSRVPASQGVDRSQPSPERVKTTLKKLLATFEGIEELTESVRTRRERMVSLQKELISAQNLLRDVRDVWTRPMRAERSHGPNDGMMWSQ